MLLLSTESAKEEELLISAVPAAQSSRIPNPRFLFLNIFQQNKQEPGFQND